MGHFICDHDYHDWDYWDFGAEYLRPSGRKRRKRDKLISPLRCQYCHPGLCLPAAAEIGKILSQFSNFIFILLLITLTILTILILLLIITILILLILIMTMISVYYTI